MKTYKVYREEHVSRNDWRDGYGDYQNLELVDCAVLLFHIYLLGM